MTIYPFIYWINVYNEIDECLEKVSGCTFAENFSNAMKNIENYYGDTINDIKLECLEEGKIIEFSTYEEGEKIVKSL